MNALDKVKNVTNGLICCSLQHSCNGCPYKDKGIGDCSGQLNRDALEVINALRDELKKRTNKAVEAKPGFITLTAAVVYSSDGRIETMNEIDKVAIRVDDILAVSDLVNAKGSEVRLNNAQQTTFYVCETIEEILGKIAKGEEE